MIYLQLDRGGYKYDMKKKWRTLRAKWFMSYDHSNVICPEEKFDQQICYTLAPSDEKLRGGKKLCFRRNGY